MRHTKEKPNVLSALSFSKTEKQQENIIPTRNKWAWAEYDELIFLVFFSLLRSRLDRRHASSPPLSVTPARATVKETMHFSSLQTGDDRCTRKLRIYHDSATSYLQYIDVTIYSHLGVLIFSCLLRNSGEIVLSSAVIL